MRDADGSLQAAAQTWNSRDESMQSIMLRIHDGVPIAGLDDRAENWVSTLFSTFPYVRPKSGTRVMEIGSGVGYIMQAMQRRLNRDGLVNFRITGLDIAENMLDRARQRLSDDSCFSFLHYDGLNIPLPDTSLDLIYSVGCLQHIPKVYVYNLFMEIRRLIGDSGYAMLHLLSFKHMGHYLRRKRWKDVIEQQISHANTHWLFFYTAEELDCILRVATGFSHVDIREIGTKIIVCVANHSKLQ